jgi:NADPH:quinone reductase-like Zn-dependent oxidoreductase
MRAIYIRQHGAPADIKISDVPVPSIGPGEVLVRVEASGINPSDVASLGGKFPMAVLPRILGRDYAGVVVKGPAELVGTDVWGSGGDLGITRDGTHAEYIALPQQAVTRRPKDLSVQEAAAVGVPFITAFSATVRLGQVKEGEWVIVSGAAGAVGQAATQIAHAKGARVIALIRDASEDAKLRAAGVEKIAHSDHGDLAAVVRDATNGKGADLAVNGVGGAVFGALLGALRIGGRQVVYSAAGGRESTLDILSFYRNRFVLLGLDTQQLDATQCADILEGLTPLFESGSLKPPAVAQQYPLSDAAQAYEQVAAGKNGKVVLVMTAGRQER